MKDVFKEHPKIMGDIFKESYTSLLETQRLLKELKSNSVNWNKIQKGELLQCQEGTIVAYIGKNKKNDKKFKGLVIDNNLNIPYRFSYSKNMKKEWFKKFDGEIDVQDVTRAKYIERNIKVTYELVK